MIDRKPRKKETEPRKTYLPTTRKHLDEFWNHRINPITGFQLLKSDLSSGAKKEAEFERRTKEKFNKE